MGRKKTMESPTAAATTPSAPSKMDVVREAIGKGIESPSEIVTYAKDTHGVEIKPETASIYKSKIKGKSKGKKAPRAAKKTATQSNGSILSSLVVIARVKEILDSGVTPEEINQIVKMFSK